MQCNVVSLAMGIVVLAVSIVSCQQSVPPSETEDPVAPVSPAQNKMVRLLAAGKPIFGVFSGPKTPEQAATLIQNKEIDFIFYSLEQGPFDLDTMQAFMQGAVDASGAAGSREHPVILRIPPIRDGREEAEKRIHQALDTGVYSIVFPHVENADDAALAVRSMRYSSASAPGPSGTRPASVGTAPEYWGVAPEVYPGMADLWPLNPAGQLVSLVLIEDKVGIANAREIVSTEGVSIVFPGPGDLRRAYERDAEAIESAIQTVLAACQEFDVVCGITAGVDDIADRLAQGFRVIIVTQVEAISVGRQAAGRTD